jgi:tetratricopeptide (TPR) repeat protein
LPEARVASAFLLWGSSKNFQHLEAIAELKRALAVQNNLPHAYNRLGTILAHIGLLDHAREMYERGRPFNPKKAVSHSIVQVYIWSRISAASPIHNSNCKSFSRRSNQRACPLASIPMRTFRALSAL